MNDDFLKALKAHEQSKKDVEKILDENLAKVAGQCTALYGTEEGLGNLAEDLCKRIAPDIDLQA